MSDFFFPTKYIVSPLNNGLSHCKSIPAKEPPGKQNLQPSFKSIYTSYRHSLPLPNMNTPSPLSRIFNSSVFINNAHVKTKRTFGKEFSKRDKILNLEVFQLQNGLIFKHLQFEKLNNSYHSLLLRTADRVYQSRFMHRNFFI